VNQEQVIVLYQPLLHSIAFKLLRCKEEAEDIVQDTFVKWLSIDHGKIQNTKAYLITAVTNNCLNYLNTLHKKKEEYWDTLQLAEKFGWIKEIDFSHIDLEAELSAAMKVLYAKLEPLEKAVYLLKEVFNFDYETMQEVLDKRTDHCRQLFCRAKQKLNNEADKISFDLSKTKPLLESFRNACDFGTISDLIANLKSDVFEGKRKK
jgi:RNA polymerase sigma factor (sigma-70 family)